MPLSWNEIKSRAIAFSKEWEFEESEKSEAQSFWNDFFQVFGISRKRIATFEKSVNKLGNKKGSIDLLWKGNILVEHKSRGKSLDKAFEQAKDYFPGLKEHELPRYILVSNFAQFRLYDLETDQTHEFLLKDFVNYVHLFDFIAGYEQRTYKDEDPVNIHAAELMGKLHDRLREIGYTGHDLEVYLVRLLFCLFADDTGIFEKGIFEEYLDIHTKEDGSDLAMHLGHIFHVLNTPPEKRLKNLDESLGQFPYVNGKLFEEQLAPAAFDRKMREMLLEACGFNWGKISPAIFGSMFQAAMDQQTRRNLGAHYTSEKNIQKVIKPLFLDELHEKFKKAKGSPTALKRLHDELGELHFLDPACGCGNFLIISYRELRDLELLILKELYKKEEGFIDIRLFLKVDVDQFGGIEYDEFPARVAEVAMWLIDHQMNIKVSNEFGQYFVRLPLKKAARIVNGNALRLDWEEVIPKEKLNYILGNPPFVGKHLQSKEQKSDMELVFKGSKGCKTLDYVTAWYVNAAELIQDTTIKVAFVSTNSISQGEQVGDLWNVLFNSYKIKIHFAHRTFSWTNEAKGKAAVHCVIIGFGIENIKSKRIFDYVDIKGEPVQKNARNITPYLTEGGDLYCQKLSQPISHVSEMVYGSKPADGGNLLMSNNEKETYLKQEPAGEKFVKPFISASEFIKNKSRWCFWLVDIQPNELKNLPILLERVNAVKAMRLSSTKQATVKWADFPTLFTENRQPNTDYILIPRHSSENRKYIPIGFFSVNNIVADSCNCIPNADLNLFGILTSEMHMTWVKYVCGRIKNDYRYSNTIVYNNFPFPQDVTEKQKQTVEKAAQLVLDTRDKYPDSSLADLYDPLTMPPDLMKAHQKLDKAVDLCYRPQAFTSELNRIEFLFNEYERVFIK
ncbi:class I SAM-dependent DNA methyltransferase [Picosynechococcus sp. PCC 73109]|uniref:class I SAM-dependent DNA methyltransferase n=1 Tax=Picosynechococcus sp. PCC 73109 TaxID=374982 RepID=UPI0007459477|nr:DNA methyltransferase [Picosynechococcus sp. PCC 73109]AMA09746.1 methylase [Picosynechococcus sp. PCC 73109]